MSASPHCPFPWVAPEPDRIIQQLEFINCDGRAQDLAALRRRLPEGCQIRPVGRPLSERREWRPHIEFFRGSVDNFLANDVELCLMRGDEILAEAYVSSWGEAQAEFGAVTRERYRGQG